MRRVIIPDSSDGDGDGDPPRLMFKPEVVRLVGHSFPTIWKWMRAGNFPLSFVVGVKTAWRADEVNAWLSSRPRSKFKESEGS
jgi:predicted DNA-binding transcriptional regulator AlpA